MRPASPGLLTDSLLAVTGVFARQVTPEMRKRAERIPVKFTSRLKRWLTLEQQEFDPPETPKDMDGMLAKLTAETPDALLDGWITEDPAAAGAYKSALDDARAYLVAIWPRYQIDGFGGIETLPLSDGAADFAWSILRVVDKPERVLDELDQWTLTPHQALAFRTCYPDLYDHVGSELQRLTVELQVRDKEWVPEGAQDMQVRILKGMPPVAQPTPPPPPAAPPKGFKLDASRLETQGQVGEATKVADKK